jgi:protein involved in polysaccharide export with SLBB domain
MRILLLLVIPFFLFAISPEALLAQNPQLVEQYMKNKTKAAPSSDNTMPTAKVPVNVIEKAPTAEKPQTEVVTSEVKKESSPFDYKSSGELVSKALKSQVKNSKKKLQRFGIGFLNNKNSVDPAAMPVPDDYRLNIGDRVAISLFGVTNEKIVLTVNNNGDLLFENYGPLQVAGMRFAKLKEVLKERLEAAHIQSSVYVNVDNFSTIQVTVTGHVVAPGLYNLRTYSTILDALRMVGGVSDAGSLRNILVKRNGKTVSTFDLYDMLRHGNAKKNIFLQYGDVIVVPPIQNEVKLFGAVRVPAIFEMKNGETLASLIKYSGGLKADAMTDGIRVKRYANNRNIIIKTLNRKQIRSFRLKNGDTVFIRSITNREAKSVTLLGNIVNPGARELAKSTTLHTLLSSELEVFGRMGLFLDNTEWNYGVIKRFTSQFDYEMISFDLSKVIAGSSDVTLLDNDEIYIFNHNTLKQNPYIYVSGDALNKARKVQFYDNMTLQDIYNSIPFKTETIHEGIRHRVHPDETFIKLTRQSESGEQTHILNIKNDAMFKLHPFDEVAIYDYYTTHPLETVSIKGQVVLPGKFQYQSDITLKKLLSMAGGFKQEAYKNSLEILRFYLDEHHERQREILHVNVDDATLSTTVLQPYDEVTIHKIPNWSEKKQITLSGEVKFPGTYSIASGETLVSVLERAGGFTKDAFLKGAVFSRPSIKAKQIEQMKEHTKRMKERALLQSSSAEQFGELTEQKNNLTMFVDEISKDAASYAPVGRISISLDANLSRLKNSSSNIILAQGDTLHIPTRSDTVYVFGEVYNSSTIIYDSNMSVEDYIALAGGVTDTADLSNVYVIKANGTAIKDKSCWFCPRDEFTLEAGDTIVVPMELDFISGWMMVKDAAEVLYQFGLAAAAWHAISN